MEGKGFHLLLFQLNGHGCYLLMLFGRIALVMGRFPFSHLFICIFLCIFWMSQMICSLCDFSVNDLPVLKATATNVLFLFLLQIPKCLCPFPYHFMKSLHPHGNSKAGLK